MLKGSIALLTVVFAYPSTSEAVVPCPPMPAAVTTISQDVRSDIDLTVGSLGKLRAGELAVKTEVTAKNLFQKYPNVDRVLTLQTMSATYCGMLNGAALTDADRLGRWEKFQDKVLKLAGNPPPPPPPPPRASAPKRLNFVYVKRAEEVKTTGNHHCPHNCDGEPTRTGYTITLRAPAAKPGVEQSLRNAKLECIAGPCPWSQVTVQPTVSPDELSATSSFDVWSKPTTWRLSAEYFEAR